VKKLFLISILIITGVALYAQASKSKAYKTGIYVFCGKELPKKFSYLIEKKLSSDTGWKVVAELKSPTNEAACQGALLSLPPSIASFTNVRDAEVKKLWEQIQKAQTLDSLYAFSLDPRFQSVAGCGWLDEGIAASGTYQYRVNKVEKNGTKTLLNEERIVFPSNTYMGTLNPVNFKPGEANIRITYTVGDSVNTAGIKLYRSQYLEKKFSEIPSNPFFTKQNNRSVAILTDASTAEGITYTYVAIPVDALGNEGEPADTLNIYNLSRPSDIGLIQKFDVTAKEKEQGIQLEWKLKTDKGIVSIDVYRSKRYEDGYRKIISLTPKETKYFDNQNLNYSIAYYYYILVNNGYGSNLPSARVPVILKGTRPNLFPPQNFTVTKTGNTARLTFYKLQPDTRGYYIYRANGYTGALKQLQRMLLSTDSALTYIDTLPQSTTPQVYSYAVAGINTSYNISPLTERESVQTSGSNLPIPPGISAILRNNSVFVTWKDVSDINPAVTGYNVYRTISDDAGNEKQTPKIIAITKEANAFTDKNISEGIRYHYYVQSVGLDTADVSSLSNTASILIPEQIPMQPGKVSAYAAEKKVVIKWDLPADSIMKKIRIYRAVAGQQATMIKELSSNTTQFEDPTVELNKMYYYFITTVSSKNKESKPTDAVSAKVRK